MPHIQLSDSRKHQYTCHPPTAPIRAHQHSLTYRICTANYAKISTTYFLMFNVVVTPSFVRMVFMRCSCANVKRTIFVATDSAALKCISCETRQLHTVPRPFDDLARVRLNRITTLFRPCTMCRCSFDAVAPQFKLEFRLPSEKWCKIHRFFDPKNIWNFNSKW